MVWRSITVYAAVLNVTLWTNILRCNGFASVIGEKKNYEKKSVLGICKKNRKPLPLYQF